MSQTRRRLVRQMGSERSHTQGQDKSRGARVRSDVGWHCGRAAPNCVRWRYGRLKEYKYA